MLRELNESAESLGITTNGEAKAVLQDAASYNHMLKTLAQLKLLALAKVYIVAGKVKSI